MKACQLVSLRRLEIRDVPTPTLSRPTDVLVRIGAVGVCGSDVHYYETGRIGSQVVQYPFTLGHECAGVVEDVGQAVSRVRPGERVAIEPAISCHECDQCRIGREHTCRRLRFLGCPGQAEGCLSEYIVMPEECCYPVPDVMTLGEAALAEPLSIGVYAVKLAGPTAGARIAILGVGPIGLSVLVAAQWRGVSIVYATDKIDQRLAIAERMGAGWTGNPQSGNVEDAIAAVEPLGLDMVFECCGEQEAVDQALRLLRPGGKLVLIGIPRTERLSFDMDLMRRREICVQNVRRQVHCVQTAIDLIASRRVNVTDMITHRFPFERTAEAFELVAGYRDGVVKAVVEFGT